MDDDGVNAPEVSIVDIAMARCSWVHRGSKPWHGYREATLNLGEPEAPATSGYE